MRERDLIQREYRADTLLINRCETSNFYSPETKKKILQENINKNCVIKWSFLNLNANLADLSSSI